MPRPGRNHIIALSNCLIAAWASAAARTAAVPGPERGLPPSHSSASPLLLSASANANAAGWPSSLSFRWRSDRLGAIAAACANATPPSSPMPHRPNWSLLKLLLSPTTSANRTAPSVPIGLPPSMSSRRPASVPALTAPASRATPAAHMPFNPRPRAMRCPEAARHPERRSPTPSVPNPFPLSVSLRTGCAAAAASSSASASTRAPAGPIRLPWSHRVRAAVSASAMEGFLEESASASRSRCDQSKMGKLVSVGAGTRLGESFARQAVSSWPASGSGSGRNAASMAAGAGGNRGASSDTRTPFPRAAA
mmetsp:Transcript_31182/g.103188  ORF Transcript_31182/g.103188 Transcript_31182/m.103188 type:complete len:308 (+) Transcript_31182:147-1070(+)